MSDKVAIRLLPTGVPGLDDILGGGIPEFSFNLIAGAPGCGKTTLAHQIAFALAHPDHPALYFTVLGEPPLKMLRYQQQFSFFNLEKLETCVRFVSVAEEAASGNLNEVLRRIVHEVETVSPAVVVIDSVRSVLDSFAANQAGPLDVKQFIRQLTHCLTSCEVTTLLVGEYEHAAEGNPIVAVADGLLWLSQSIERNSVVRKLQVKKSRGQGQIPGLHTFRVTNDGVRLFPRVIVGAEAMPRVPGAEKQQAATRRLSTGVTGLDEMLGGGVPVGYSVLVSGPSGSGKSVLATTFITEGARNGEPGVLAVFEKRPSSYVQTASDRRLFDQMVQQGHIEVVYSRPLDLSIDETLHNLVEAIRRVKARRVVIDSLSGFELAVAPTFRDDFRETLYRMVAVLTSMGITVMMTAEVEDSYADLRFSAHGTAFLTDAIIMQRYIELEGQLRRVTSVVKLRGSAHSKDLRAFEITEEGMVVGAKLTHYRGMLTGTTELVKPIEPGPRADDAMEPVA